MANRKNKKTPSRLVVARDKKIRASAKRVTPHVVLRKTNPCIIEIDRETADIERFVKTWSDYKRANM